MPYLCYTTLEIVPVRLILAQETDKHAGIQPRQRHLPDTVAVEGLELRGGIRSGEVSLRGTQVLARHR